VVFLSLVRYIVRYHPGTENIFDSSGKRRNTTPTWATWYKLGFSLQIFEKYKNFTKICPVGEELFHADGGTDRQRGRHNMTKLIVDFRNFAKRKATKG